MHKKWIHKFKKIKSFIIICSFIRRYIIVTGILYKKDEPLYICINISEIKARQGKYFTKTLKHDYQNKAGDLILTFENIPRNSSGEYNLQFQVNAIITKNLLIEEYQIFNKIVDLTGIKLNDNKLVLILVIISNFLLIKLLILT